MKSPKPQNIAFGLIQPNADNYRCISEYFPGGKEEQVGMGKGILMGGIQGMSPLRLSKRSRLLVKGEEKGDNETLVVIGGNRRYWALESQEITVLTNLKVPCLVYEGLSETEELEISLSDNEGIIPISPWGNCKVVERLVGLSRTQQYIAERFNWSIPQVSNLLLLTRLEPWIRAAGESGKISASLVWQLYNTGKGKRDDKVAALNALLSSKREVIESKGVTARDFNVKELAEARSTEIFNQCVSEKAQELAIQMVASKELDKQAESYRIAYDSTDKLVKELMKLDKQTGDVFFDEFSATTKPMSGVKTSQVYEKVTMSLFTLSEKTKVKLKEVKEFQTQLVRDELLKKEQAGMISPEERQKLEDLTFSLDSPDLASVKGPPSPQGDNVKGPSPQGDIKGPSPQGDIKGPSSNVKGPAIDDSFSVKTTVFLDKLIFICDKAVVSENTTADRILDSLKARIRTECYAFLSHNKLVK